MFVVAVEIKEKGEEFIETWIEIHALQREPIKFGTESKLRSSSSSLRETRRSDEAATTSYSKRDSSRNDIPRASKEPFVRILRPNTEVPVPWILWIGRRAVHQRTRDNVQFLTRFFLRFLGFSNRGRFLLLNSTSNYVLGTRQTCSTLSSKEVTTNGIHKFVYSRELKRSVSGQGDFLSTRVEKWAILRTSFFLFAQRTETVVRCTVVPSVPIQYGHSFHEATYFG